MTDTTAAAPTHEPLDFSEHVSKADTPEVKALKDKALKVAKEIKDKRGFCDEVDVWLRKAGIVSESRTIVLVTTSLDDQTIPVRVVPESLHGKTYEQQAKAIAKEFGDISTSVYVGNRRIEKSTKFDPNLITGMTIKPPLGSNSKVLDHVWAKSNEHRVAHLYPIGNNPDAWETGIGRALRAESACSRSYTYRGPGLTEAAEGANRCKACAAFETRNAESASTTAN